MSESFFNKVVFKVSLSKVRLFSKVSLRKISSRHSNTGEVSSRVSLTSWGEVVSLALVGHPYSDGITIKNTLWCRYEI